MIRSGCLDQLEFPEDLSRPLPKRKPKKSKEELDLEVEIAAWPEQEKLLWGKVMAFRDAVGLISRRYLSGQELLYPHSAREIEVTLDTLAELRDVYRHVTSRRPPESEEGFLRRVLEEPTRKSSVPPAGPPDPAAEKRPDTRNTARSLAEHHVLMARAEALEALGERDAGIRLVENWMLSRD